MCTREAILAAVRPLLDRRREDAMLADVVAASQRAEAETAWRIEGILREFAPFAPINLWFDYPLHTIDDSDLLTDVEPEAEQAPWQKATEKRKKSAKDKAEKAASDFLEAIASANPDAPPTTNHVCGYLGVSKSTVGRLIKKTGAQKVKVNDQLFVIAAPGADPEEVRRMALDNLETYCEESPEGGTATMNDMVAEGWS